MKSPTPTRIDACTQRDPVTGFCFMPPFTDKPVQKFQPTINSVKRRVLVFQLIYLRTRGLPRMIIGSVCSSSDPHAVTNSKLRRPTPLAQKPPMKHRANLELSSDREAPKGAN